MVELHLIEEHPVTGHWMSDYRRAARACLQLIVPKPLPLDSRFFEPRLHFLLAIGFEKVLPAHVQVAGEGAHIKQPFALELPHHIGGQLA